ncbi:hypothetical protein ACVBKF_09780, partial [Shewanella sp. 0m-11]
FKPTYHICGSNGLQPAYVQRLRGSFARNILRLESQSGEPLGCSLFASMKQLPTPVVPMACGQRMCRHFLGTLQVLPCKLYDGIHAIKGLSRIYTGLEKH